MRSTDELYLKRPLTAEEAGRPLEVNGVIISLGSFLTLNDVNPADRVRLRKMKPMSHLQVYKKGTDIPLDVERLD